MKNPLTYVIIGALLVWLIWPRIVVGKVTVPEDEIVVRQRYL